MALLRPMLLTALLLLSSGCVGEAEWLLPRQVEAAPPARAPGDTAVRLESWQDISAGLPQATPVGSMAHFDGTVYAVAGSGPSAGLFALPSGASVWAKAGPSMRGAERPVFVGRFDLAVYLTAADLGLGKGSVYRLELGDEQWSRLDGAPDLAPSALLKKGGELLAAFTGSAPGLYASADGGTTWKRRAGPAGYGAFLSSPVRTLVSSAGSQRLFAGTPSGLFYSDDLGASFFAASIKGEVRALHASGVYVLADVAQDGAMRSDNFGNTWHPVEGLGAPARSFFLTGARTFAGTSNGVKLSDDGGGTWRDSSEGLPAATEVRGLYLAGSSLFSATPGTVFVATVR
ncbi:MAG: WD40/YVTN/BNR-like repeat-containing protein [Myxococcaceae bacterium]